jgi:hypothetical protein
MSLCYILRERARGLLCSACLPSEPLPLVFGVMVPNPRAGCKLVEHGRVGRDGHMFLGKIALFTRQCHSGGEVCRLTCSEQIIVTPEIWSTESGVPVLGAG